ncbi:MAG: tRNA (adenosine(37)-N6)-dimethylallyltransferase MiaA [Lentisphaeria bacterium]|nr:tRNA (adenosine(37)-N6)-dimethylallyltransferase MiaA [Lentisphaeria bacterium]
MLLAVMGPTASGKSKLALELAQRLDGEIVSADSMQLYRGLAIGTAQPTAEEQQLVPHHLVGVLDLTERADVVGFVARAEKIIADIESRGKVPVIAGGTGYYLKALLYGLDDLPADAALRAELDQQYDSEVGGELLRERMIAEDSAAWEKYGSCRRKLIRALEVRLLTGRSIIEWQQGARKLKYPVSAWKLEVDPAVLREKIARRAGQMLAAGWVEEARQAIAGGLLTSPTAHQALGYSVIAAYLDGGLDAAAMEQRIMDRTCQFARRQRTWFRHQHPEAQPIVPDEDAAGRIEQAFRQQSEAYRRAAENKEAIRESNRLEGGWSDSTNR